MNFVDPSGRCYVSSDKAEIDTACGGSGAGSNDMETVNEGPPQKGTAPGSVSDSPNKVTNLAAVPAALRAAIGRITANCLKVLPSTSILLGDVDKLTFFDARPTGDGSKIVAAIAPTLASYNPTGTLQAIAGGANAVTLFGGNKTISNTILLGSQFFLDPTVGNNSNFEVSQGTVLIHELLHYATQLGDDAFASGYGIKLQRYESSSSAINRWLQNDCRN